MKDEPEVTQTVSQDGGNGNTGAAPLDLQRTDRGVDDTSGDGEAVPAAPSHRDLQRWALQELVALANECAQLESEMDRQLKESLEQTKTKDQKDRSKLEWDLKSLNEQVVKKSEERRGEIESRYQQMLSGLKASESNARKRALAEYDQLQADVKQKYQQACWLAESVLEAAEAKAAEDLKRATELHAVQVEHLNLKDAEVGALMNRYGQRPPAGEPLAAIKEAEAGSADPTASYARHSEGIERHLHELANLSVPKLFVGGTPHLIFIGVLLLAAAAPQVIKATLDPQWPLIGIAVGAAVVILTALFLALRSMARKQVAAAYIPLRHDLDAARICNDNMLSQATMQHDLDRAKAKKQQKAESQLARDTAAPALDKGTKRKDTVLQNAQNDLKEKNAENETLRTTALAELEDWRKRKVQEVKHRYETELANIGQRATARRTELQNHFDAERAALTKKWVEGLASIQAPMQEDGGSCAPWSDASWADWKSPTKFPHTIRFGELQVDIKSIIAEITKDAPFTLPVPETFSVPALMAFPNQASLLIHAERAGRAEAIKAMQMVMTRLLTCIPPGRVRFTLIDPVGLGQNFAGFMHLADYDEALVGGRIWTDSEQIDQRLANLSEHMETVIQKYLRNEFATIDDYNAQAGELAEPYRFLVISDFPVNFSDEAMRRLSSIASTGARCGVYTLVMRDVRIQTGSGSMHVDDLEAHSVNIVRDAERFVWRDEIFQRFPLTLDPPPTEDELTKLLHQVGKKAREAKRVEVAFEFIAPKPNVFWSLKSDSDVAVAVGRSGATRLQTFRLGKGVAQHALVAGKTGSGKSTLLHALISNLAMWYSPDEIELYLIDFKKGVEFKTYAMHQLPHARAIAVESDREFGLSVLQRIDAEMTRRAELFRPFKAQNLSAYRDSSGLKMPRTLLIIDEFQEFFSEDDKLAQDAALLLDRIVRQGRAFGVHLLLGSQTIGGSSGLSRSTIGQIAVRIALQTSEADSQMILGDGNSAARLLSRPGEAIYNDQNGLVEGNSPFQVAWLPDEQRDRYLDQVTQKANVTGIKPPPPIVFEGNEPADFRQNQALQQMLEAPKYQGNIVAPLAWLGDPVSIKAPTSIPFRRQSGSNVLVIGQADESALAMMSMSAIALGSQLSPQAASFFILDGTPADSPLFGVLANAVSALPHQVNNVEYRAVADAIHKLALELQGRQASESSNPPAIFVLIFGLQRYRALRKSEDTFGFSSGSGDEEKPPDTGKEFADLLREGPGVGIHTMAWIDTATALERTLDRGNMREFDNRVLFQMSATDSSNLVDSPIANKLGANRALAYSEEQGSMEKFRPYAAPDAKWLAEVKQLLSAKSAAK